ncbi:platelet binding protein GspB-like [Argopecten irradians]|uniref:platelet binding protein GspB-like n=1 Tax=Argopecten irradians TaxID=31199 RepID=UPI00371ED8C0
MKSLCLILLIAVLLAVQESVNSQIQGARSTLLPRRRPTGATRPSVQPGQRSTGATRPSVQPIQNQTGATRPSVQPIQNQTGATRPSVQPMQNQTGATRPSVQPIQNQTGATRPSVQPMQNQTGATRPSVQPIQNQTGATRPSVQPIQNQTGATRPSVQPGGRPTLPSRPSVSNAPVRPSIGSTVVYSCPKECTYCQTFGKSSTCMAYDQYGQLKQKVYAALPRILAEAYNETSEMNTFKVNAKMASCEGFKSYMTIWAKLSPRTRQNIKDFFNDTRLVTPSDMARFPKEIYASLKPDFERVIYRTMNQAQKEQVCDKLKSVDCLIRSAILRNLDCSTILLQGGGQTLSKKDLLALVDLTNYTNWDDAEWNKTLSFFAELLTYKHFEVVPIDVLINNMGTLMPFCGKLSVKVVETIAERTQRKMVDMKRTSSIPANIKSEWMDLLSRCGASPDFFDGVLDVQEAMSSVDMSKADPKDAMKYMEKNSKSLDVTVMDKDQIVNFIKVLAFNKTRMMELNETALEMAACDICKKASDLQKSDLRMITKVLQKKLPTFTDPTLFDASKVECIGCMLPFFPKAAFDQVPPVAMQGALTAGDMKNMTMKSRSKARSIMNMAKTAFNKPNGDFSSDDLEKMGSSVLALKATEVINVPDASFTDSVVESLDTALRSGDMEISKAVKAKFIQKIKSGAGIGKVLSTSLAKEIPTSDLDDASVSDFDDLVGETNESTIECNTKQARFLMKKVKSVVGDVTSSNTNFTLMRVTNILPYTCGFTKEDVINFVQDSSYIDILKKISETPCLTRGLSKTLYEQRKNATSFDSTDAATLESETTSSTVSQMSAQILAHHSKAELDKYGASRCLDILEKISTANTKLLTKAELKDKWDYFVACVGKTIGTITKDDLKKAGNLLCGITKAHIEVLDSDALDEYASVIQKCSLDEEDRQALVDIYVSKMGITSGASLTSSAVVSLGTTVANLPSSILNTIPDQTISDLSETIMKSFKEKEESDKEREKSGFKSDIKDADKATYKRLKIGIATKILSAKESIATTTSGLAGRRKRSTASLTCSDLQAIGTSGLSALTTTQISNMNDQEYIDCAETLGSVTDYSDDQETALLALAMRSTVWGDPSTWAATDVYNAGVICQAMTESQIGTLTLDLDAVSRLGQFSGWDSLKKKALYQRWLTLEKGGDSSTITSSELRSLGHVTCGAETGHINVIQSSVYQNAADAVGEVTSCEDTQLQAFAALAKAAYGSDVTQWDTTVITNVGIVIGGLTASEISTLSETQIDAVEANHITYIPDTTFTGFTVAQISTFSTTQAQSTTINQRAALDSAQLAALEAVAAMTWTTADSGVGMPTANLLVMLFTVICCTLFNKV